MKNKLTISIFLVILIATGYLLMKSNVDSQRVTPSWQGIMPGQTTKEQVLTLLGEPDDIGEWRGKEIYFQYGVSGTNASHRIFFRKQMLGRMVVSWLDVAKEIDKDDPYYIHQALREYGVLDAATKRDFHDYQHLETLYVWADQGTALIAAPSQWLKLAPPQELSIVDQHTLHIERNQIWQRYIVNDNSGYINYSNPYDVVIRLVIFSPMKFSEFWSEYGLDIVYDPLLSGDFYFSKP